MSIHRMGTVGVPTYTEDASDSYTKLLLHCDGANGSTTFTDKTGKTITPNGNAQISTEQSKFRGASAKFDGSGDFLTCGGGTDFAFGTGDFTVDFWVFRTNSVGGALYDSRPVSTNGAYLGVYLGSDSKVLLYVNDATKLQGAIILPINVFNHIAVARASGVTKLYVNGVLDGSVSDAVNYLNGASRPVIGANGFVTSASNFNGYIDELRVSKGIARWTANFTPPTAPYDTTITQTPTNINVEIKQQFRGLSGVNREVKQQYRGYSGVNRLVFNPKIYLYNMGDSCTTLTGGWNTPIFVNSSANNYPILGASSIYQTYILDKGGLICSDLTIDISNYSTLKITSDNFQEFAFGISSTELLDNTSYTTFKSACAVINETPQATASLDISAYNGNYYIRAFVYASPSSIGHIYTISLE